MIGATNFKKWKCVCAYQCFVSMIVTALLHSHWSAHMVSANKGQSEKQLDLPSSHLQLLLHMQSLDLVFEH